MKSVPLASFPKSGFTAARLVRSGEAFAYPNADADLHLSLPDSLGLADAFDAFRLRGPIPVELAIAVRAGLTRATLHPLAPGA